ncbi:MAG: hypothetical protein E7679_02080 [Ruminococcaceae bacterium]|nr:hypothetical protein [Oscillospiraceae bacterium]
MKVKINFFAIMLFLSIIASSSYYALIPMFAAVLHELGHIVSAQICDVKLNNFSIGIFGARLGIGGGICSYKDEIIICAAGPAINFISAYFAALLSRLTTQNNDIVDIFILSSLCLGIINMLPIRSLDGGRIISALICRFGSVRSAELILDILSFITLFTLWCISLYLLLRSGSSLSLFVFSVSIFASIFLYGQK